ncbi:MAG: gliding motility-associated C-terminal domain-containing protein [Paramuribaculum sp.]|nr:gliding motility-associated C-terminal domain-containing protein [Paramuribaculum sp.]
MNLLRLIIYILCLTVSAHASAISLRLAGASGSKAVSVEPVASSGLNAIFVVPDAQDIVPEVSDASTACNWYIFDSRGAAYAQPLENAATLSADCGYIIEDAGKKYYFWITDYSASPMTSGTLDIEESDCSSVSLLYTGSAPRLTCHSITGRALDIDREISLTFFTLDEDSENLSFSQIQQSKTLPYINQRISMPAPLCSTRFVLTGDRFLRSWGKEIQISSDIMTPQAVSAIVSVSQIQRDSPNEQKTSDTYFGGSAPVDMQFKAVISDAVVFTEWQIASDIEFDNIIMREQSAEWDYTFTDTGSHYIRFLCANSSGSCEWYSDTYIVAVGESRLRCPNAFSPGATEGVNDEWRVSYRSIISFECHIFNRLGVKMATLTDPSQGWDGKYKGHLVAPGVYYYVIKALGADGKKYNLSGDINIVGSRSY